MSLDTNYILKNQKIFIFLGKNKIENTYLDGKMNNKLTTKISVKDNLIGVMRINNKDYISLTDLARYKNPNNPGDVIIKWMSNKSSFDFYCLWEELFNEDFKLAESREFKNDSANQSFTMSPSRWISMTNAKGFVSKRGKYDGGTFAHPDIALTIYFCNKFNLDAHSWIAIGVIIVYMVVFYILIDNCDMEMTKCS